MTRRLPPEVVLRLTAFHAAGFHGAAPGDETFTEAYREAESAILAACDAAERRGIERAALVSQRLGDEYPDDHGAGVCYKARELILALPVPEEGA